MLETMLLLSSLPLNLQMARFLCNPGVAHFLSIFIHGIGLKKAFTLQQGSFGAYQHASGGRGVKGDLGKDLGKSPDIHVLATELQQKLHLGQGDLSQGKWVFSKMNTESSPVCSWLLFLYQYYHSLLKLINLRNTIRHFFISDIDTE